METEQCMSFCKQQRKKRILTISFFNIAFFFLFNVPSYQSDILQDI